MISARPDWKTIASLAVLATSASCVPSLGSAGPIAPVAGKAAPGAAPATAQSPNRDEQFWRRAAELLAPVSAEPAAPFAGEAMSEDDRARSIECLTSAVYHEARSEPVEGQRAVAQVVLNRVRHPAFPDSVCGVVFQGSQRRTGCQFSFTCDGSLNRPRETSAWTRAGRIAEAALGGGVFGAVGNATHYHTTAIRPYWAPYLRKSAIVGSHIFYRWNGGAGEAAAFRQRYGGLESVALSVADPEGSLPRVHDGFPPGRVEDVRVDEGDGTVRIHRGAARRRAPAEDYGVRVHVGSAPAAG